MGGKELAFLNWKISQVFLNPALPPYCMECQSFLQEKKLLEIYPNMCVSLRIAATAPVTVASAERSFSTNILHYGWYKAFVCAKAAYCLKWES